MEINKAIQTRRSVRKFNSKKPGWRDVIECVDAMRYAPMAGNNFSLKIILITEKEKIEKLANYAQQSFISETKYVVVVCSNPKRTQNLFKEKAEIYLRQQAGAAIQNFLLKIHEKGLATCWIGHFMEDKVKNLLKIPDDLNVEAFFPIGYEYKKPLTRKAKIDLDSVIYFDLYKNKRMRKEKGIDV